MCVPLSSPPHISTGDSSATALEKQLLYPDVSFLIALAWSHGAKTSFGVRADVLDGY